MAGTTLQISNNSIIIQHDKTENSMYDDGDKQTVLILMPHLSGLNINHTKKIITLYTNNMEGMASYTVDFNRGSTDQATIKANFSQACTQFGFASS
jgi:hypothetical protein